MLDPWKRLIWITNVHIKQVNIVSNNTLNIKNVGSNGCGW